MTNAERKLLLIVAKFIDDMELSFANEFDSSRTEGLHETILEIEAEQAMPERTRQADRDVGQGRILRQEDNGFVVSLIGTDRTYLLLSEEILVQPELGAEGRLVLRDTGFLVSCHLVPNA